MTLSGRSIGVRILVWANVTVLFLGLLFLRNGKRTLAEREERNGDKIADPEQQFPLSDHSASYSRDIEVSAAQHRIVFSQPNGLSSGTQIQNGLRASPLDLGNPLYQKSSRQVRKHLIFRGLVQCCRGETAVGELKTNGRVLVTSTHLRDNEVPEFEEKYSSVRSLDEATFHIDYSSPKTHPPKNN